MVMMSRSFVQRIGLLALFLSSAVGFSPTQKTFGSGLKPHSSPLLTRIYAQSENAEKLSTKFGGYTVKQRLREEVESPFRKVRLVFFGSSAGSALTALYFSATNVLKAKMGGYPDSPSLEDSLTSCGINVAAAIICAFLAYRDYKAGEANLARIARGGALAKLNVMPAKEKLYQNKISTLGDYRRTSRVLICAGGEEYIEELCRSLNSDQMKGENVIAQRLAEVDVLVVPVLLLPESTASSKPVIGDCKVCWAGTLPTDRDRNFDSSRADDVIGFPRGDASWSDYLKDDFDTAQGQGFDVLKKGITVTVKKNGKILRRATGMPRWLEFVDTLEVADGSKFGMPGDSEKYGGP